MIEINRTKNAGIQRTGNRTKLQIAGPFVGYYLRCLLAVNLH